MLEQKGIAGTGNGMELLKLSDSYIEEAGARRGLQRQREGNLGSSLRSGDASVTIPAPGGTRIRVSRPTAGKAAAGPAGRGFEGVDGDDTSAQAQATEI